MPWVPAKKDEGRWEGNTGTSHLSTLMGGRVHVEKWIVQKPPKPRLHLTLPAQGALAAGAAGLPGFAAPPPRPCSPLHGSDLRPQTFERWAAGGKGRCQGLGRLRDNGSWELLVLHGACNPVFWERDLRWRKSIWYGVFWVWIWEGLWQMSDLAIKNRDPNTSERQLNTFLRVQSIPNPVLSALYALCSLKSVSKLLFQKHLGPYQ